MLMMALHSMERQRDNRIVVGGGRGDSGDSGTSSSSIALLQERFRQLQRMREKREEMELLKSFAVSETMNQTKYYEVMHQKASGPTVMSTSTRSSFRDSVALGLDLYGKKTEEQTLQIAPFRDFLSMDSVRVSTSRSYDKPDVDTSLHL